MSVFGLLLGLTGCTVNPDGSIGDYTESTQKEVALDPSIQIEAVNQIRVSQSGWAIVEGVTVKNVTVNINVDGDADKTNTTTSDDHGNFTLEYHLDDKEDRVRVTIYVIVDDKIVAKKDVFLVR